MKAHELFRYLDPALVTEMFTYFRESERDVYKSSLASLASSRKLRPVFVQKKPVVEQIAWMHKTLGLRTSDTIGEHLLQVWFMKGHQPMLTEFCDVMEIEHNGEGSVEGDLPEELDGAKLGEATEVLLGKFHPGLVALYLHVFNLQRPGGWECLHELLRSDERVRIGDKDTEPADAPPAAEAKPEEKPEVEAAADAEPAGTDAPEPAEAEDAPAEASEPDPGETTTDEPGETEEEGK